MTTARKAYKGPAMEGAIANWYARITKRDRGYIALASSIASRVRSGAHVLEIAPGPGYLAIELARRGLRVSGVDISRSFVRIANEQARAAGARDRLPPGQRIAAAPPGLVVRLRRVSGRVQELADPVGALDESYRVLVPGGQAAIIDLRKEASRDEIDAEVDGMQLSWLNRLWTRWTFRWFLLDKAYTKAGIERLVEQSRFGRGELRPDGVAFELRLVKPQA